MKKEILDVLNQVQRYFMRKEKLCSRCGKPIIDRDWRAKHCWQCYSERSHEKKKVIESPKISNDNGSFYDPATDFSMSDFSSFSDSSSSSSGNDSFSGGGGDFGGGGASGSFD